MSDPQAEARRLAALLHCYGTHAEDCAEMCIREMTTQLLPILAERDRLREERDAAVARADEWRDHVDRAVKRADEAEANEGRAIQARDGLMLDYEAHIAYLEARLAEAREIIMGAVNPYGPVEHLCSERARAWLDKTP